MPGSNAKKTYGLLKSEYIFTSAFSLVCSGIMISRRISCRGTDHIRRRLRGATAENSGANGPSPPFDRARAPMSTFTPLSCGHFEWLVAAGDKRSLLGRAQGGLPIGAGLC